MPVFLILILLGTGLAIGFISGLLGIGGGIIMTPIQYWIYTSSGMSVDLAIKISFATTLAVILPTAASGVWQHQKQGGIYWKAAIFMGIFTAIGSFGGSFIAAHISGSVLKIAFGIFSLIIAIRMLTVRVTDNERPIRENRWLWFALALPIGVITGILGIGGGIIVVPILMLVLRLRMCRAIGTSLGMMLFTSVGGIIGYVINGATAPSLPAYTLGYIYWPAWIALSVTSIGMAQVGAILAHRVPGKQLNYIFIALLFYISLDMLGVIDLIAAHFR
jgi:uncharacterized protein